MTYEDLGPHIEEIAANFIPLPRQLDTGAVDTRAAELAVRNYVTRFRADEIPPVMHARVIEGSIERALEFDRLIQQNK